MNLIYLSESDLKPTGGPAGYLYNLREGLRLTGDDEVCFLPERAAETKKAWAKEHLPKRLLDFRKALRFTRMYKETAQPPVDLNQYETVHFHRTDDLYRCRKALEHYNGQVLLTSHTPCARFRELTDMLHPADRKRFHRGLTSLEQIDAYAFERADHILFPCQEAEEPYYHTWERYASIRQAEKYYYIPTGIKPVQAKQSRQEIREKYQIPQDAWVITYVGRHNEIKGYDRVKELAKQFAKNPNVYFLIAGKEEPLKGLNQERWIEVGWTKDPHSIIAAADVFLLPNRETYFDLIMLEVLSLGQIVVASKTGGNQFFESFHCDGIRLFDQMDEAAAQIEQLMQCSKEQLDEMRRSCKQLFEEQFTVEVFAKRYRTILQQIRNKES